MGVFCVCEIRTTEIFFPAVLYLTQKTRVCGTGHMSSISYSQDWSDYSLHDASLCYCTKGWAVHHRSPYPRYDQGPYPSEDEGCTRHLRKGGKIAMHPWSHCNSVYHTGLDSLLLTCFKVSYKQNLKPSSPLCLFVVIVKLASLYNVAFPTINSLSYYNNLWQSYLFWSPVWKCFSCTHSLQITLVNVIWRPGDWSTTAP